MTHGLSPDQVALLGARATDGELTCPAAFALGAETGLSPAALGEALDERKISIVRCQLGLFGYAPNKKIVTPATRVDPEVEAAVRARLVDGRLPCASAWELAAERGLDKMAVAAVCEALKIKISRCQLGAF